MHAGTLDYISECITASTSILQPPTVKQHPSNPLKKSCSHFTLQLPCDTEEFASLLLRKRDFTQKEKLFTQQLLQKPESG